MSGPTDTVSNLGRDFHSIFNFRNNNEDDRQFTIRGIAVGLFVGTLLAAVNVYFGLQTGYISLMSMPASLLSFVIFKSISRFLRFPFGEKENVFVQTVSVAVGCMSLSAGLVGVIPAIEKILAPTEGGPIHLSIPTLIVWSLGLAFFGVIFSVPLRKQVIIKEKLRFPSGTATATMISILHQGKPSVKTGGWLSDADRADTEVLLDRTETSAAGTIYDWRFQTKVLSISFGISVTYTVATFFFPILRDLPVFGTTAAQTWLWTVNPSPAYIGQGIIMGQNTTLAMLLGAIVGWGILSPVAKAQGWAPGLVSDWKTGSRGWIVWISLSIMLVDSIVSLLFLAGDTASLWLYPHIHRYKYRQILSTYVPGLMSSENDGNSPEDDTTVRDADFDRNNDTENDEDAPSSQQIGPRTFWIALALSTILCTGTVKYCFPQVPFYLTILSLFIAFLLSIMAARALGQTDLNPVSGISKIAQLVFALIVSKTAPSAVLINLVAGAISEAAGQQAGDILQDLKTSHLLHASPKAQFYGQLVGAAYGAVISSLIYRLYDKVYSIPSKMFEIPAAVVWIDCSRLLYGSGLPKYAREFCVTFGITFTIITVLKLRYKDRRFARWLPGGIAVAIGMYNTPPFTLARVIGGLAEGFWKRRATDEHDRKVRETTLILVASGAIIGEGLASLVNLGLTILTSSKPG